MSDSSECSRLFSRVHRDEGDIRTRLLQASWDCYDPEVCSAAHYESLRELLREAALTIDNLWPSPG